MYAICGRLASLGVDNDRFHKKLWEWYLNLRGSLTYHANLLGWTFLMGLGTYHYSLESFDVHRRNTRWIRVQQERNAAA